MADVIYPKQNKTIAAFLPDFARFLIDDHATIDGPANPWTIVETYSGGASDTHEIPGDTSDMDSLASDNAWRTGTLAINDWIVLESGSAANKFRVGLEYQANDQIKFILDYKAGFTTGQENVDMTTAGNWSTTISSVITMDNNSAGGAGNWSVAADRDQFKIFYEDGVVANMQFMYCGKLDDTLTEDEYSAVIFTDPNDPSHAGTSVQGLAKSTAFEKLAISDDSTVINAVGGHLSFGSVDSATENENISKDSTTSKQRFYDVVLATTSGANNGGS